MSFNFNEEKRLSVSQKVRKITTLRKFIIDTIDNDQAIKRLLRYLTSTPLSKKGVMQDGKVIQQPDLTTSLKEATAEGEKCLYTGLFDPYMEELTKNYIFVQHYQSYVESDMTTITYLVHIIISDKYNELKNYGQERNYEIADRVAQLLDTHTIDDEEIIDLVGNVRIDISGNMTEMRLTKTKDFSLLTVPLQVRTSSMRFYNYE